MKIAPRRWSDSAAAIGDAHVASIMEREMKRQSDMAVAQRVLTSIAWRVDRECSAGSTRPGLLA
jgi:hypothetical protein